MLFHCSAFVCFMVTGLKTTAENIITHQFLIGFKSGDLGAGAFFFLQKHGKIFEHHYSLLALMGGMSRDTMSELHLNIFRPMIGPLPGIDTNCTSAEPASNFN